MIIGILSFIEGNNGHTGIPIDTNHESTFIKVIAKVQASDIHLMLKD